MLVNYSYSSFFPFSLLDGEQGGEKKNLILIMFIRYRIIKKSGVRAKKANDYYKRAREFENSALGLCLSTSFYRQSP